MANTTPDASDPTKSFEAATSSSDTLVAAVTSQPAYWLENLKLLWKAADELEQDNIALRVQLGSFESTYARASELHDENQQLIGGKTSLLEQVERLHQHLTTATTIKASLLEQVEQLHQRLATATAIRGFQPSVLPPAARTERSPLHPDPAIFYGKRENLEGWIIQLNIKMQQNGDHFVFEGTDTNQNEMLYVLSRLGGDALAHVQSYVAKDYSQVNLDNWKKIVDIQNLVYGESDPQGAALNALIGLYQNNENFDTFWAEFHRLGQKAEMSSDMMLDHLKDRVSNEIKARLVMIDDTEMTLEAYVKVVRGIAANLDIPAKPNRRKRASNRKITTTPNSSKPTFKQANSSPTVAPSTATSTYAGHIGHHAVHRAC